jgi:hypothetical protein
MDITLNVTFGDDLSLHVDLIDATLTDAQHMLGSVCNELLRTNLALTMQGEASAS